MEIILKEDVANLGYKDDIVKVRDGYGRNWLIPQKKAVIATPSAKKMLAEDLRQRAHKIESIKNEALALAEKIKDLMLTISAKTSTTGKIFGAVGPAQLAEALGKAGYTVDRKIISLKEPVKELGQYSATIKLHREVNVDLPFEVIAEG
ncbi:MAG: 50S ribosomal protein L9 [Prevotellaceae bacterium]|jgi:large subunit ribosomal protein L9|nr:50S ribosomal protein L9 [Prevotellaceae bacterium]